MAESVKRHKVRDWIGLSSVHGIGPSMFFHLVRHFGSPTQVLNAPQARLKKVSGMRPEHLAALADTGRLRAKADIEVTGLERIGARPLIFADQDYPEQLRHIGQPPPVIYVHGKTELLVKTAVAVVGSRAATSYGRRVSFKMGRDLALSGICVVSGLALGIDAEAHAGCLSTEGETIAVLGCGLDVVYPRPNRQLFDQIKAGGLLVSEYPLGTPPEGFRFPARNRIIAGLSRAVVVVEASKKSGSLITVQYGLDEGREIFAVPGQVDSLKSAGTHWLVQQGAALIVSADDILEHLSLQSGAAAVDRASDAAAQINLDPQSTALLALMDPYPQPREQLLQRSGLSASKFNEILLLLELEGLVELVPGDEVRKVV